MESLKRKLVWLVASRAAILGVLFVITVLLGRGSLYVWPVSLLALLVCALSFIYAIALRANLPATTLIPLQLGNDVLLVTWLIYRTGDVESPFTALYLVIVFAASLLSSRRGILAITLLSIALPSLLCGLILTGVIPRAVGFSPYALEAVPSVQYHFALTIVAMLAVSILSTSLSDRQRKSDLDLAAATRRLADLRAFNERIIESMRSGLVTVDLDRRIATFNRAAEEITGYSAAEAVGKSFDEVFKDVAAAVGPSAPRGETPHTATRSEATLRRRDGRVVHLGFSTAPLTAEDGAVRGLVLIFQDVSEIFELEQEIRRQEKLAALGAMAAGLAHEIRNPLASMRGSIQVLESVLPLGDDDRRLMEIILRESDRLNRTVTDFLSYARHAPFDPTEFDLKRWIADAVALLRNSPELRPGHEVVEIYPEGELRVVADANKIRQVFWNLARNGLQAMPNGGRLTVRLRPAAHNGVMLTVEDEGVGMTQEQIDKLFEPFAASSSGGTGLGMAIAYRLVADHGGRIAASSEPDAGTRIQVWIPARYPGADSPLASERLPAAAESVSQK
jgi:two-component system sensor histidine kinase PilS (NtrC family)